MSQKGLNDKQQSTTRDHAIQNKCVKPWFKNFTNVTVLLQKVVN